MAGKNVEGQLELFSLFDSVEELEQKIKGAGLKEVQGEPVMEQCYRHRDTGETDEAAVAAERPEALQKAKAVRWENTEVEK